MKTVDKLLSELSYEELRQKSEIIQKLECHRRAAKYYAETQNKKSRKNR